MDWIDEWKKEFEGKNIAIWGYGREGKSSARLIHACCPDLAFTIVESRSGEAALKQAEKDYPFAHTAFYDAVDWSLFDLILKSPGIVLPDGFDLTHLSGETQLFLKHYRKQVIGITGTKGKSTTTSLVYQALSEKYHTHLVGNIGIPCFDAVPDMHPEDLVAFEISCHQLEYCLESPSTAVFLNLYEEHLDHYGTLEKYGAAKANIYRHQREGELCILNTELKEYVKERPDALLINRDIYADGHTLHVPGHCLTVEHCRLIGEHNYSNLAVAYEIALRFGISDAQFLDAASRFEPLHHRLEDLGEYEGVRFVNDSISTIGQSCIKALESLPKTDVVLVGGKDRGIEYHELEDYLAAHPSIQVVFMYASGKRIYEEMKQNGQMRDGMYLVDNLEEAVEKGRSLTRPHHICLLSPAASSYDHFKNFEERGEVFRKLAFHL